MLGMAITVVVFLFIMLIAVLFAKKIKKEVKSPKQKREEIISSYKQLLKDSLKDLPADEYENKKVLLLKKIARELEFNLFFQKHEIKNIIQGLANES